MKSEGWVKLWRGLAESGVWARPEAWGKIWVHILMTANYKPWKTPAGTDMPPGSRRFTVRGLAKECYVSERKVRGALAYFYETHMATHLTTQETTQGGSYLTILNWERYQSCQGASDTQRVRQTTHSATRLNKEEEDKRSKEENSSSTAVDAYRNGTRELTPPEGKAPRASHRAQSPEFEAFWAMYPWKTGKLAAARQFAALLSARTTTAADIMAGLTAQLSSLQAQGAGYRLHPVTWLRQGRYADEPTTFKVSLQDRMKDL